MLCFVTQPNHVVMEVEVDAKAKGQSCLDKICQQLGIIERDYFGLQYEGAKGEHLWLNLRNSLCRQLHGNNPCRLRLRVKFFVRPHMILQEHTRRMFYLQLKTDLIENQLKFSYQDKLIEIIATISQAELGDFEDTVSTITYYKLLLQKEFDECLDEIEAIGTAHAELAGMKVDKAHYHLIQTMSEIEGYGVEYHNVKWGLSNSPFLLGVGPDGIHLFTLGDDRKVEWGCVYSLVVRAIQSSRCIYLHTLKEDGSCSLDEFKLMSNKAAKCLYRCVTEMHSFHRCDTVRSVVQDQFSRGLKGHLVALFDENLGKDYVFDIQRTSRESYDHARRLIYEMDENPKQDEEDDDDCAFGYTSPASDEDTELPMNEQLNVVSKKLERYQDALYCRVCMDKRMNTTFQPCGHVVCCQSCAERVTNCPICRNEIDHTHQIFLPSFPSNEDISVKSRPRHYSLQTTSSKSKSEGPVASLRSRHFSAPCNRTISSQPARVRHLSTKSAASDTSIS